MYYYGGQFKSDSLMYDWGFVYLAKCFAYIMVGRVEIIYAHANWSLCLCSKNKILGRGRKKYHFLHLRDSIFIAKVKDFFYSCYGKRNF